MAQTKQEEPATLNPMQLQLLKMFSYVRTEEELKEIKSALSDYFFKKVEEGMDMLCEQGNWDEAREESVLKEHLHTPYVYWWNGLSSTQIVSIQFLINSEFVELITPYYHFELITADHDDNKFVDCAMAANATYIVTDDKHYKPLEHITFPHITVIQLMEFVNLLRKEGQINK